ncbi:nitrite reductase small subunit NirD [Agarilytica rhodophyticola]|uniref:nitrite reductase small subunit NirD n=1 Tax=Agarilytica rhodophyticola TaxID=1737490 RepID=UPI000B346B60|nr:nitrite reductase small subunit NirD [Agarilytica rhodophyticola]
MISTDNKWQAICKAEDLSANLGVRAILNEEQVAIFKVRDDLYAISAIDPFSNAAVLSRGIVGDLEGAVVLASPVYKQHFCLKTGSCLEDDTVKLKTYPIRDNNGRIELAVA